MLRCPVSFVLFSLQFFTCAGDITVSHGSSKHPLVADIVLAIDTAHQGWGDRSESDVCIDALQPFLRSFTEKLWRITGTFRMAIVEMAKESNILVELNEGVTAKAVINTFNDKSRRLSLDDRSSTGHIYRMLTVVNTSLCNHNITGQPPCMLILLTVAPAPVRVSFVGADWPNWRTMGDAIIRSAFDHGVDIVILSTGYRDELGAKPAGLLEMARVEGKINKIIITTPAAGGEEVASKSHWNLTYWQAPYDKTKSVDDRVANKTLSLLIRLLSTSREEKETKIEGVKEENATIQTPKVDHVQLDEKGQGFYLIIYSTYFATLAGFSLKRAWRLLWGGPVDAVMYSLFRAVLTNFILISFILLSMWVYFLF